MALQLINYWKTLEEEICQLSFLSVCHTLCWNQLERAPLMVPPAIPFHRSKVFSMVVPHTGAFSWQKMVNLTLSCFKGQLDFLICKEWGIYPHSIQLYLLYEIIYTSIAVLSCMFDYLHYFVVDYFNQTFFLWKRLAAYCFIYTVPGSVWRKSGIKNK